MNPHTLFTAGAALAAAIVLVPSGASAQSSACYKGSCAGLDEAAVGSNYGQLDLTNTGFVTHSLAGVSGGDVDASYLGNTQFGPCVGFATVLPDHLVTVDDWSDLRFEVTSSRDVALLIAGPDGWRCNDDSRGTNPGIGGEFGPGTYRIWVSSYSRGYHDYELQVRRSERDARDDHHGRGRGDWDGRPGDRGDRGDRDDGARGLDATATAAAHDSLIFGFETGAAQLSGRAGGSIDASYLQPGDGSSCVGFTQREPDHILTLTDRFDLLQVAALSSIDTTLIIHGPHGWRCNDDFDGTNPGFADSFPPGTYRIWVGAYDRLDSGPYTLEVVDLSMPGGPFPPPEPLTWSFSGRFEDVDVAFSAGTPDGIYRDCMAFAGSSDSLDWVDDIVVNGTSHRYGAGFWTAEQLCAIATLNAVPSIPFDHGVRGSIEEIPYDVRCGGDDARRLLDAYVPRAAGDLWIDDITVNGTPHHNGPGYWSAAEATAIIGSAIVDPYALYVASGSIESTPFSFSGDTPAEIQAECNRFVAQAMSGEWIDDVTVNGQARHNNSGWWNATDLCMIVSSLATAR